MKSPSPTSGSPAQGTCTRKMRWTPMTSGLVKHRAYVRDSLCVTGSQDCSWKVNTQFYLLWVEHRGSSLKSAWVVHEWEPLINFRAWARGAEICRVFSEDGDTGGYHSFFTSASSWPGAWWEPFLKHSIYCANTVCPTPVFCCRLLLPNLFTYHCHQWPWKAAPSQAYLVGSLSWHLNTPLLKHPPLQGTSCAH